MHCHILPGLDDGAKSMKETMQVLEEAVRQNISCMIATPHYHPGRYIATADEVLEALERVRRRCERQRLPITLLPGQECYYHQELTAELDAGRVLTLAGSRYVLVEFEPDCFFSYLLGGIRELQNSGYRPILAHFERYACLRQEEHLRTLKEHGCLLQLNFDRLRERDGLFHKNPWRQLVKQGMVDYLGSDCHGMEFRPLHVLDAYKWLSTNVDPACQRRMLVQNVENICMGTREKSLV